MIAVAGRWLLGEKTSSPGSPETPDYGQNETSTVERRADDLTLPGRSGRPVQTVERFWFQQTAHDGSEPSVQWRGPRGQQHGHSGVSNVLVAFGAGKQFEIGALIELHQFPQTTRPLLKIHQAAYVIPE